MVANEKRWKRALRSCLKGKSAHVHSPMSSFLTLGKGPTTRQTSVSFTLPARPDEGRQHRAAQSTRDGSARQLPGNGTADVKTGLRIASAEHSGAAYPRPVPNSSRHSA
eukprot:1867519-Rhodomonas_salina.1